MQGLLEQGDVVNPVALEVRLEELVEDGAMEPLADRVVVGRSGRDGVMDEPHLGVLRAERVPGELGRVVFLADVKRESGF